MRSIVRLSAITLLLGGTTAIAQPYGYLTPAVSSGSSGDPANAPAQSVDPRLFEQMFGTGDEQPPRQIVEDIVPENLRGRVERGVLPDFMARNYNQGSSGRAGQPPARRSTGSLSRRGGPPRRGNGTSRSRSSAASSEVNNFTSNAFLFDSNQDGQLAAHELSNMFLVLTSDLDAEDNGTSRSPVTGSQESVNQNLLRRQSVREAESVFLKLTLDFDRNADGLLNRAEVGSMASCLQQNNLSLLDASQQATQPAPVFQNSAAGTAPINSAPVPAPAVTPPSTPPASGPPPAQP
ncbi:MAG: hypothetical protein NXI04_02760 [Planctomycetaceae bacterium]|nr:hypothetical protein [Planctomycetaceae bacterium]